MMPLLILIESYVQIAKKYANYYVLEILASFQISIRLLEAEAPLKEQQCVV